MSDAILEALEEPVVVTTEQGEPILVIRNILDDDAADELIARHPEFQASVARARRQKAAGQVRSLADLRRKYAEGSGSTDA